MAYEGSPEKVPPEYWEYRLVHEHFRGNWLTYWMMPEPELEMIARFRIAENEAALLQEKRLKRGNYGRPKNRPSDSN